MPEFKEHLEKVKALHDKDLDEGNIGVTIFMNVIFKRPLNGRSIRPRSVSVLQFISFATVLQVVYYRPITIFVLFRNCWATVM